MWRCQLLSALSAEACFEVNSLSHVAPFAHLDYLSFSARHDQYDGIQPRGSFRLQDSSRHPSQERHSSIRTALPFNIHIWFLQITKGRIGPSSLWPITCNRSPRRQLAQQRLHDRFSQRCLGDKCVRAAVEERWRPECQVRGCATRSCHIPNHQSSIACAAVRKRQF